MRPRPARSLGYAITSLLTLASPALAAPARHTQSSATDPMGRLKLAINKSDLRRYSDLNQACENADFRALAVGLNGAWKALARSKTEYESDAEYRAFVTKIENSVNGEAQIIVCQPLTQERYSSFKYDAERERFIGRFSPSVTIHFDRKAAGRYLGTTALGMQASISKFRHVDYRLSMTYDKSPIPESECIKLGKKPGCYVRYSDIPDPTNCFRQPLAYCNFEVPALRSEASTLKSTGYLVYTGTLRHPFMIDVDIPGSPTLTDRVDVNEIILSVEFSPKTISVVGNGKTYWSMDFDQEVNETRKLIERNVEAGRYKF
jgi:hypothetical protein